MTMQFRFIYLKGTIAICLLVGDVAAVHTAGGLVIVISTWEILEFKFKECIHTPSRLTVYLCTIGLVDRFRY